MPVQQIIELTEYQSTPVFSFNKAEDRLAFSPNDSKVHIYAKVGSSWTHQSTLSEHTERVTGIDWSKTSNRLVTCAADRNAYVWTEEKPKEWKPSLVILRINRAAIKAKWAPSDTKFAVGTGSKLTSICYYEQGNDWWVSKHLKKSIRSSVLDVAWHPQNSVLATGSTDFYVRVFACAIKGVDSSAPQTPWGGKEGFGHVLAEFKSSGSGWIHSVCFSPSGDKLVWTAHDATVTVADTSGGQPVTCVLKVTLLPLLACLFLTEDTIIAAGHDKSPYKFKYDGKCLTLVGDVDTDGGKQKTKASEQSAMSKFRNLDTIAQTDAVESTASNKTHANTLTQLCLLSGGRVASAGLDHRIVIWEKL